MTITKTPKHALAFIFVTITLDMLAMSVVIPVLPRLVLGFMHGDTATASRIIGIFGTAWALMQFIFSPIMGALSDRFGRRRVILISNFGLGADFILMALAPGIGVLFIGRIISGITGASISTAQAYIADISPPEKRAQNFGMMSVAFGLGFVLGPALGGIAGQVSPRLPFWLAAGLSLANACYGIFVLPESLKPENRTAFSWRKANPLGSLKMLRGHLGLLPLACIHFLFWLSRAALPAIFVLYCAYRYGWDTEMVGLMFAVVGIFTALVGGLLVRPVVAWLGERRSLVIGLLFGAAGMGIFGLAAHPMLFWAGIPLLALMGLSTPALQGLMTARVAPSEQGALQGAFGSVAAIAQMIGPSLFAFVFAQSIAGHEAVFGTHMPGAPFYLAAALLIAAAAAALRTKKPEASLPPALLSQTSD
jgi:DHA1 family tetracycline resistance protein-like MFS transporter